MSGRLLAEFQTLQLALQFLTRLPLASANAYSPERMAASVRHYPLVGVLIGAVAALLYFGALYIFPPVVAVFLSIAAILLLTGGFHEDGLADTFDGIGGGHDRERVLEIMRDSRIGTYGALALLTVVGLKITALTLLPAKAVLVGLIAAHGMSRWSSVLVIATSRYARDDGTGKPTADGIGVGGLIYASLVASGCVALLWFETLPVIAGGAVLGMVLAHIFARLVFEQKVRGYTGDCLGAVQQLSELGIYLGILACL